MESAEGEYKRKKKKRDWGIEKKGKRKGETK